MNVPVVDVGEMGMLVGDCGMDMPMRMGCIRIPREIVGMLVVLVMCVTMLVFDRFMPMFMFVSFGQMQPYAGCHEHRRDPECGGR